MKMLSKLEVLWNNTFSTILGIFSITKKQHTVEQLPLSTSAIFSSNRINKIKVNKACKGFCFLPVCVLALSSICLCQGAEIFIQHMPDCSNYYQSYCNAQSSESIESDEKSYIIDLAFQFEKDETSRDYSAFRLCLTHSLSGKNSDLDTFDHYHQPDWNNQEQYVYCYTWEVLKNGSLLTKRAANIWILRFLSLTGKIPQLHFTATEIYWNETFPKLTCLVYPMPGFAPTQIVEQQPGVVLPDARQDQRYLEIFQNMFCLHYPGNSTTSRPLFLQSYETADYGEIPSSPALYIGKIENGTFVSFTAVPEIMFRKANKLLNIEQWVQFFEKTQDDDLLKNGTTHSLPTGKSPFFYHSQHEENHSWITRVRKYTRKTTQKSSSVYGDAGALATSKKPVGARTKDRKKTRQSRRTPGKNDFLDIYPHERTNHYPDDGINGHFLTMPSKDSSLTDGKDSSDTESHSGRRGVIRHQRRMINEGHKPIVNGNSYGSPSAQQARLLYNPYNLPSVVCNTGQGSDNPALSRVGRNVTALVKNDREQQGKSEEATGEGAETRSLAGSLHIACPPATHNADDTRFTTSEKKVARICTLFDWMIEKQKEQLKKMQEAQERRAQKQLKQQEQAQQQLVQKQLEQELREQEWREQTRLQQEWFEQQELRMLQLRRMQLQITALTKVEAGLPVQQVTTTNDSWFCEHYQRHCRVKFSCCNVFYPCHFCHNNAASSDKKKTRACKNKEAKANHATHMQCRFCRHEQEIDKNAGECQNCKARMSEYFCAICKLYTSSNKKPSHCEKCGICRTNNDQSFHCEVCNVCLNKRLLDNHPCRADSGHEACCICLNDSFSDCEILPCSHKVHSECALEMIQNGVSRCPVCRRTLPREFIDSGQS